MTGCGLCPHTLFSQALSPTCTSSLELAIDSQNYRLQTHQQALTSLAADICFEFQPLKCISLHFNGHRVVPTTEFSMSNGNDNQYL